MTVGGAAGAGAVAAHENSKAKKRTRKSEARRRKRKDHVSKKLSEKRHERTLGLLRRDTEFLCDLQFRNTLPPVPFNPKFLRPVDTPVCRALPPPSTHPRVHS